MTFHFSFKFHNLTKNDCIKVQNERREHFFGRLLWGDSGVIESPNFPQPYGPNMDCLWLLQTADEDARIKLVCDTIQVLILQ